MKSFIAYDNFADRGIIAADTAYPSLPASFLQSVHISKKWRSTGLPAGLLLALDDESDIDVVALIGCNATDQTAMRIRIGGDAAFGTFNYDSGVLSVDPKYSQLVHVLAEPASGSYVRIDVEDEALSYFQAGRLFVSKGFRPRINVSWGAASGFKSLSRAAQSRGGQTYIDLGPKQRVENVSFGALGDDEIGGFIADLDRVNGTDIDILICRDAESDNPGRDTLFGTVKTPSDRVAVAPGRNSKSYLIEERL
jgi:hypothetical protein